MQFYEKKLLENVANNIIGNIFIAVVFIFIFSGNIKNYDVKLLLKFISNLLIISTKSSNFFKIRY